MAATVTPERLARYFVLTQEALAMAKQAPVVQPAAAEEILDTAQRYYNDACHFQEKGEIVNAFACLNYAHGWLDAGARLKLFVVTDSRLFAVDEEE